MQTQTFKLPTSLIKSTYYIQVYTFLYHLIYFLMRYLMER